MKEHESSQRWGAAGGKSPKNTEELAKATKMRVMTVNEIGDAMKRSLQYDKVCIKYDMTAIQHLKKIL